MRIALVEDNEALRKGVSYRLEDEGYGVDLFSNGLDAEDYLRSASVDLIILDINLPGQSGLEVLRAMRRHAINCPVILLTARGDTEDRVAGLDAGADDYLVKPFAMDELVARVRALARRRMVAPMPSLAIGELTLELQPPLLRAPSGPLDVPRRELSVLTSLAQSQATAMSKSQLLDAVYGIGADADEQVIEVYVSRLRKRLAPFGIRIAVRRGIGYALELPR